MATEYKALAASSVSVLTTDMNAEIVNGYFVIGPISSSQVIDSLNVITQLHTVIMERQTA